MGQHNICRYYFSQFFSLTFHLWPPGWFPVCAFGGFSTNEKPGLFFPTLWIIWAQFRNRLTKRSWDQLKLWMTPTVPRFLQRGCQVNEKLTVTKPTIWKFNKWNWLNQKIISNYPKIERIQTYIFDQNKFGLVDKEYEADGVMAGWLNKSYINVILIVVML